MKAEEYCLFICSSVCIFEQYYYYCYFYKSISQLNSLRLTKCLPVYTKQTLYLINYLIERYCFTETAPNTAHRPIVKTKLNYFEIFLHMLYLYWSSPLVVE